MLFRQIGQNVRQIGQIGQIRLLNLNFRKPQFFTDSVVEVEFKVV